MANVTIWHNPRCSKSRDTFNLLEEKGIDAEVIKYLDTPPTKEELKDVLKMLGIAPRELMRTKEDVYKELNLAEEKNDEKLIEAMVANPKLIERPIVIKDGKAVIGRPLEKVIELIS
ncbi:arsenate reductase (glutaredoxin) [Sulfurovum sp. zt1-1]|uniref:Arsenate reductase (Glutaredoxin) n=1 Tax=Sulfurovum zhangzhouensis TaxID=3019067 RepID=A0ABT7QVX8_9BACT|nr:arsenate reductase (glutaredoxin) [Sulfurovum zhangzhouensis]MDM5270995.1 arsenate reductase (glutaredoxin) [Sulfurovum zhangzhouensis]